MSGIYITSQLQLLLHVLSIAVSLEGVVFAFRKNLFRSTRCSILICGIIICTAIGLTLYFSAFNDIPNEERDIILGLQNCLPEILCVLVQLSCIFYVASRKPADPSSSANPDPLKSNIEL